MLAYIGGSNSVAAAGNVIVKADASADLWSGSLAVGVSSAGSSGAISTAVTALTLTTTAYSAAARG